MANYMIGDMIYEKRISRGYSQEELSFGICSTSSLSRIENNIQVPGKKLFDALMQRLGVSESIYSAFVSKEEMELVLLKQKLVWKLENLDFTDIDPLVKEMGTRIHEWNHLDKQYLLLVKASILKHNHGEADKVLHLLLDAIHVTMPGFSAEEDIKKRLLTFDEITILNSIALEYDELGERKRTLKLLFELKEYLENHRIDGEEMAQKYPLILYNLTRRLGENGRYGEVQELCEKGIEFCISHSKLNVLPYLITNQACASAELKQMDMAKRLFRQAAMLFEICHKESLARLVKREAKDSYQIIFSDLGRE